jgi:hypothetical protein
MSFGMVVGCGAARNAEQGKFTSPEGQGKSTAGMYLVDEL